MKSGLIAILSSVTGFLVGADRVKKIAKQDIAQQRSLAKKHLALYMMMNRWVQVKQDNKSIATFLEDKGMKRIAVYGVNIAGKTLLNELKNTNVKVIYGIDRNADCIEEDIDVVSPESDFESVDAIIVTAITFFEGIKKDLSEKVTCPILSLEDILYEMR